MSARLFVGEIVIGAAQVSSAAMCLISIKGGGIKKTGFILMLLVACSLASTASALEVIAEARIESTTGEPVQEELRFWSQGYEGIVLNVQNGEEDGSSRVSSVVVSLNSVKVLSPADFNQKVAGLQRSIAPHDQEIF